MEDLFRYYCVHVYQTSHSDGRTSKAGDCHFLVLIQIAILDLEPNPCFYVLIHISKTIYLILNLKNSNNRSCEMLHFIQ